MKCTKSYLGLHAGLYGIYIGRRYHSVDDQALVVRNEFEQRFAGSNDATDCCNAKALNGTARGARISIRRRTSCETVTFSRKSAIFCAHVHNLRVYIFRKLLVHLFNLQLRLANIVLRFGSISICPTDNSL